MILTIQRGFTESLRKELSTFTGTGRWEIEACYQTGRLGDSLFPNAASFKAVRRNGQLYLYHRVIPAVLRLDPTPRKAVPVAIAGRVINRGRTFFQFAGSGRDGYPKPWVAAAEHHSFRDLAKAPKLYSWADSNGNGEFEPGRAELKLLWASRFTDPARIPSESLFPE